jgi:hypothetical protein
VGEDVKDRRSREDDEAELVGTRRRTSMLATVGEVLLVKFVRDKSSLELDKPSLVPEAPSKLGCPMTG